MLFALLGLLAAYLLGSIPTGYLLVKAKTAKDIRTLGSGNIGSTNVGRVLGGKWGYLVLFLDTLKGLLGVLAGVVVASAAFPAYLSAPDGGTLSGLQIGSYLRLGPLLCPFATVAGHCYPPWIGWRGGKGVATMFGSTMLLLALLGHPLPALFPVVVYLFFSKVKGMVSLGSIAAALSIPLVWLAVTNWAPASLALTLPITFLVLSRHRENIKRLLAGTERRMGEVEEVDES